MSYHSGESRYEAIEHTVVLVKHTGASLIVQ